MNSTRQAQYSYRVCSSEVEEHFLTHNYMHPCRGIWPLHLTRQLCDADAGSQPWARVFTENKVRPFTKGTNSLDVFKKTPAAKLKLQRRRSYLMADVLVAELPINNVN